jgi:putative spermidine/putrescine transport system permease protein
MPRALASLFMTALYLFLFAPLVVIAIASMAGGEHPYVDFPPDRLSFEWYGRIPYRYVETIELSLLLAIATAVCATALSVPAALGLVRGRFAGREAIALLLRAPLQIPFVVVGIAFLQLYYALGAAIGVNPRGQFVGLLLGHVFLTTPYALGTVGAVLQRFNPRLEEAARTLGATRWRTFRRITLPVILPGVYAGALYAFIVSFGEVPVALFLSSPSVTTFPVEMFGALQFDFNPSLLAVSTLILVLSLAIIVVFQRVIGVDALLRATAGREL